MLLDIIYSLSEKPYDTRLKNKEWSACWCFFKKTMVDKKQLSFFNLQPLRKKRDIVKHYCFYFAHTGHAPDLILYYDEFVAKNSFNNLVEKNNE